MSQSRQGFRSFRRGGGDADGQVGGGPQALHELGKRVAEGTCGTSDSGDGGGVEHAADGEQMRATLTSAAVGATENTVCRSVC